MKMLPSVKISRTVMNRINNVKESCIGRLYGTFHNNIIIVLGMHVQTEDNIDIIHSLPTEVDLCGIFKIDDVKLNEMEAEQIVQDVLVTDNPVYLHKKLTHKHEMHCYHIINGHFKKNEYTVVPEKEIYSDYVHLRLKTKLPLMCDLNQEAIKDGITQLANNMSMGLAAFNIDKTEIFIMGNSTTNVSVSSQEIEIGMISDDLKINDESKGKKKKDEDSLELDILQVNMFKKATIDPFNDAIKKHAPIVQIDKRLGQMLVMALQIDSLSLVHRSKKLYDVYDILIESIHRNLRLLKDLLLLHVQDHTGDKSVLSYPEVYHFFSEGCGHFITRAYEKGESETALLNDRTILHKQLLLPMNKPVFRRGNRYTFKGDNNSNKLINPHQAVKPTTNGGKIALVQGKYTYYHYNQDRMDDNGWGCAYRSLQTLASWFIMQGYTDKPVPTFAEIQKCLVDIGDKPSSFIDSRQWIGSTEVNFVLNTLLNVECKILYVSSGEEMSTKGPELLYHFEYHGSPIMIGGGVLAHTILGVDYNQETGSLKFLILDPHYIGSEDLQIIIKKGWCGWKGVEFWDKKSYYNMCLPQVPKCI